MDRLDIKNSRALGAAVIALALAGCGPSVRGPYEGDGMMRGMMSFDFKDRDTVRINAMGQVFEGSYKIDGRELKITANNVTQIFTLDDDRCFNAPPAGRMCPAGKGS